MALSATIVILLVATIFLPSIAMATEFVVGDGNGWNVGVNYTLWAADKTFQVGDTLVFRYPVGEHNVFKVNGSAFQSCTIPPPSEALSTGNDHIVLTIPGRKWYICGVGDHCEAGQKLVITVQPQAFPPSLPPAPSPRPHRPAHFGRWVPTIFH